MEPEDGGPLARHIVRFDDDRNTYGLSFLLWDDGERAWLRELYRTLSNSADLALLRAMVERFGRAQVILTQRRAWHETWWGRFGVIAGWLLVVLEAIRQAMGR